MREKRLSRLLEKFVRGFNYLLTASGNLFSRSDSYRKPFLPFLAGMAGQITGNYAYLYYYFNKVPA
jgi:hypothetical protein